MFVLEARYRLFIMAFLLLALSGFLFLVDGSVVEADPEEKGEANRPQCLGGNFTACGRYCYWAQCVQCTWCCGGCNPGVGCVRPCFPLEIATTECYPCTQWRWHLFDYSSGRDFSFDAPSLEQAVDLSVTQTPSECTEPGRSNGIGTNYRPSGQPVVARWDWAGVPRPTPSLDSFGAILPPIPSDSGAFVALDNVLVSISDPMLAVLVYSGLPSGHGLEYRLWYYDGRTESWGSSYPGFQPYSAGQWVGPSVPGIHAFQLRSVNPTPVPVLNVPTATPSYGGRSEVVYELLGADRLLIPRPFVMPPHLPIDERRALFTPEPPPPATSLPAPGPSAPDIDMVEVHPSRPNSVLITLDGSFSGRLQVRYWLHNGFLPPERYHVATPLVPPWLSIYAGDSFYWIYVSGCSPCSLFSLAATDDFGPIVDPVTGLVSPLIWDFQVRAVDIHGRAGNPSNVVVLEYDPR